MSDEIPSLKVNDLPPMGPRWFVVCSRCQPHTLISIGDCAPDEEDLANIRKNWASDHGGEGPTIAIIGPCTVWGLPGENKIVEGERDPNMILEVCDALILRGTKPTVPEVRPLVEAYYAHPGNEAGGSLHVVLDDHNVEDDFVRSSIDYAFSRGDLPGASLGRVLLMMSKTQRLKVRR